MDRQQRLQQAWEELSRRHIISGDHAGSDYFPVIKGLLARRDEFGAEIDGYLDRVYGLVHDEIVTGHDRPRTEISFGTSGWRGILGKDIYAGSVRCVTAAICRMYRHLDDDDGLATHLGVASLTEARLRGCLVGHDNRFAGDALARTVTDELLAQGFRVFFCGETTTGVLSAALLKLGAAFSINLTPSHNPLDYGGYKYNAADGGPAAAELTGTITRYAREAISQPDGGSAGNEPRGELVNVDSLALWQQWVRDHAEAHGLDYDGLVSRAAARDDLQIVVDAVHGASRLHIERLLGPARSRLQVLRGSDDVTFGGIAPEPSSANLGGVSRALAASSSRLRLGAIIDPDGDRIRFTDGSTEIGMNQFGALAYYFIHERKGKKGLVAKTVATSNLVNAVARGLGEEVFETRVGFKEFKPVIGQALVCFEESDGISIIGHTPEKDAYIGLLLAIDMMLSENKNLGELLQELTHLFGAFYPDRDGVTVSTSGAELDRVLAGLNSYRPGVVMRIGDRDRTISEVIAIDGRKMIFDDGSWLMIRPSGTEPKVRFYVESRSADGTGHLVAAARALLADLGLL
ncbi:phosphoglucomutase [Desulfofustis limnaeus]|uniref:Phosphomannomutase n=1 Tax=Desulfofustis limnaeus TaxID=2740163 RepID=A0ABN6M2B9_9BACT|nr:phosphoglucomutase [Desulfofustis limnaeus]MDX9894561.1 phosphoglucomutase [Desulfofustis sp.]BDD87067.1 phosphomannomutase [Desulfofustis limnaeus]